MILLILYFMYCYYLYNVQILTRNAEKNKRALHGASVELIDLPAGYRRAAARHGR